MKGASALYTVARHHLFEKLLEKDKQSPYILEIAKSSDKNV